MNNHNGSDRINGAVRVTVEVKRSLIDGRGLFAKYPIKAKQKLGDLSGEVINQREARRRAKDRRRVAIVELGNGKAIDAARGGNELRYVNHSCSPNTFMRIFRNRVEFYALQAIRSAEELTCDYGETHHNRSRRCECGSRNCRGFI